MLIICTKFRQHLLFIENKIYINEEKFNQIKLSYITVRWAK